MSPGSENLFALTSTDLSEPFAHELVSNVPLADLLAWVADTVTRPIMSHHRVNSFVLHAPLELLARLRLFQLSGNDSVESKLRLVSLATRYREAAESATANNQAMDDAHLQWAQERFDILEQLAAQSADRALTTFVDDIVLRTGAAGHGIIAVGLMQRTNWLDVVTLTRGIQYEIAKESDRLIAAPSDNATASGSSSEVGTRAATAWHQLPHVGAPSTGGIAALVDHGLASANRELVAFASASMHDPTAALTLLRHAAACMLMGAPEHGPYGWSHALTLTMGGLAAESVLPDGRGLAAAATYLGAHVMALGSHDVRDSVQEWSDLVPQLEHLDATTLVESAAVAHDAHLVKYTVDCLSAASYDPEAAPLYFAAATTLHQWWNEHPAVDDPLLPIG